MAALRQDVGQLRALLLDAQSEAEAALRLLQEQQQVRAWRGVGSGSALACMLWACLLCCALECLCCATTSLAAWQENSMV